MSGCGAKQSEVPIEKTSFSGKLLFWGPSNEKEISAYEIAQGDPEPTLMWSLKTDLETNMSRDISTTSPKHTYGIVGKKYMLNLLNGEAKDFQHIFNNWDFYLDFGYGLTFSPNEEYLAEVGKGGVQILNLKTGEVRELVSGKCQGYGSVLACLDIGRAVWLDEKTLIFENNKNIFSENYEFPGSILDAPTSNTEILEYVNELSAIDLDGNILFNVDSGDYYSFHRSNLSDEEGDTILYDIYGIGGSKVWFSKGELLINKGLSKQHEIGEPLHAIFNTGGKSEVLSPNGHYLLRFPSDIVDLRTGNILDLNIFDQIESIVNEINFDTCVWNPDEQQAVCKLTYFGDQTTEKDDYYLFVFVSTTGKPVVFARMNSTNYFSLQAWLP